MDFHNIIGKLRSIESLGTTGGFVAEETTCNMTAEGTFCPVHGMSECMGYGLEEESNCNMTAEGEHCPVHGMEECSGYGMREMEIDPATLSVTEEGMDDNVFAETVRTWHRMENMLHEAEDYNKMSDDELIKVFRKTFKDQPELGSEADYKEWMKSNPGFKKQMVDILTDHDAAAEAPKTATAPKQEKNAADDLATSMNAKLAADRQSDSTAAAPATPAATSDRDSASSGPSQPAAPTTAQQGSDAGDIAMDLDAERRTGMEPPAPPPTAGDDTITVPAPPAQTADAPSDTAAAPTASYDSMSFGAAFAAARKEAGGKGGVFMWKGKPYQTNVKGESPLRWNDKNLKRVGSFDTPEGQQYIKSLKESDIMSDRETDLRSIIDAVQQWNTKMVIALESESEDLDEAGRGGATPPPPMTDAQANQIMQSKGMTPEEVLATGDTMAWAKGVGDVKKFLQQKQAAAQGAIQTAQAPGGPAGSRSDRAPGDATGSGTGAAPAPQMANLGMAAPDTATSDLAVNQLPTDLGVPAPDAPSTDLAVNQPAGQTTIAGRPDIPTAATPPAPPATAGAGADKLTFKDAFAKARKAAGGGQGVFTWKGKQYQTNIQGEPIMPVSKLKPVQVSEADISAREPNEVDPLVAQANAEFAKRKNELLKGQGSSTQISGAVDRVKQMLNGAPTGLSIETDNDTFYQFTRSDGRIFYIGDESGLANRATNTKLRTLLASDPVQFSAANKTDADAALNKYLTGVGKTVSQRLGAVGGADEPRARGTPDEVNAASRDEVIQFPGDPTKYVRQEDGSYAPEQTGQPAKVVQAKAVNAPGSDDEIIQFPGSSTKYKRQPDGSYAPMATNEDIFGMPFTGPGATNNGPETDGYVYANFNEGLTINTTRDMRDGKVTKTLNITATDEDAESLAALLRNAGLGMEVMAHKAQHGMRCDGCGLPAEQCHCAEAAMMENADYDYGRVATSEVGEPLAVEDYIWDGPHINQRFGKIGDNTLMYEQRAGELFATLSEDYTAMLNEAELENSNAGFDSPLTANNRDAFDKDPFTDETAITDGSHSPLSTVKRQDVMN